MTDEQSIEATPEVPAGPEQLDMSMRADANVNWVNPDSLTIDQQVRIQGINTVLGWLNRQPFTDLPMSELIDLADVAAAYIKNGKEQAA